MDFLELIKVGVATVIAITLIVVTGWFVNLIHPKEYLVDPAIEIAGMEAPPVDLASIQQSWPRGLGRPEARPRLRRYMGDIENAVVPEPAQPAGPVTAEPEPDFAILLAEADPAAGQRAIGACTACHSFEEGGQDRIGPNLWGVVGRDIASHGDFAYSPALAEETGDWTFERLNDFLASPARAVPDNGMNFLGVRRARERASILAYLRTLSDNPVPLPEPPPEGADASGH